tara:strand:+ start:270949 stop:271455 length:507 start_codon:yes stop_codon:yes gene_type:complete
MAFWEIFKKEAEDSGHSKLREELRRELPELSDVKATEVACIAGLMARVAYVDFKLEEKELIHIKTSLKEWTNLEDEVVQKISDVAIHHIKELAGLENHLYVYPLREILNTNEKFSIVEALFALAASDEVVENIESEEIRLITRGLELSDQHFLAARAKVIGHLKALQK